MTFGSAVRDIVVCYLGHILRYLSTTLPNGVCDRVDSSSLELPEAKLAGGNFQLGSAHVSDIA